MASIRKRGDKWQVQVRRKSGFQKTASFTSRKDADRWARSAEMEADKYDAGLSVGSICDEPLVELLERYRATILPLKRSAYQEGYILNALGRQAFAKLPIARIRPEQIARFRDERLAEVSASTLNRTLVVLSHVFETARTEWGFERLENPVSKIRKPKPNPSRARRLSEEEERHLIAALVTSRNPVILPLTLFALETGMRLSEMLGLRWDHVDFESRMVELVLTKNGRGRHVPLSTRALKLLHDRREADPVGPFLSTPSAVKQAWRRSVRRAGLEDLHFHDLRHEAISRLFERGLSLPEVALVSGHSDPRMLMRYTHMQSAKLVGKL